MRVERHFGLVLAVAAMLAIPAQAVSDSSAQNLANVGSFAAISDPAERSAALFTEVAKVLTHPRCMNCHPAGDRAGTTSPAASPQSFVVKTAWPSAAALSGLSSASEFRSRPSARRSGLAFGARRDGLGRQDGRADMRADRDHARNGGRSPVTLCTMSEPIIWWVGLGRRVPAVSPLPVRKRKRARCSTNG